MNYVLIKDLTEYALYARHRATAPEIVRHGLGFGALLSSKGDR